MKVLHIVTGLSTGGAERALLRICENDGGAGVSHAVVSLKDAGTIGPQLEVLGVPVFALNVDSAWSAVPALARLRARVKGTAPDVIQGWMYHGNAAAVLARRWAPAGTALAWNVRHCLYDLSHEKRLTRWVIRANRALSGKPAAIVYNSDLARLQHEAFGFSRGAGRVIPNGFDVDRFRPDPEARRAVRAELGIPEAARVIGHVGRLHPVKDHAGLLRALAPVLARHGDVHVVLAGRNVTVEHAALAPGLARLPAGRVRCLGERSDVARLMAATDVVVSSSYSESFPNVLGEAMACGVPCIATDVGDSASVIGDNGRVVPPRDSQALGGALEDMLCLAAQKRAALGRAARKRIQANYSIRAVAAGYRALYEELAAAGRQ